MDITRTIPADESQRWLNRLFDGRWATTTFPLAGAPSKTSPGDSLFLIYRGHVVGRFKIIKVRRVRETVTVGSQGAKRIAARCKIVVQCPGERPVVVLRRRGHQGVRYVGLQSWRAAKTNLRAT